MEEKITIEINIKHNGQDSIGTEILLKTIESLKEYEPIYNTNHKIVLRPINNDNPLNRK